MISPKSTFLIFMILSCVSGKATRPFTMDIKKLNYVSNENLAEYFYLKLYPYKNGNAFNGSLKLRTDLKQFYFLHWVTSVRPNGRTWLWYNVSVNGCEVLENKFGKQNPIAGAVMRRVTHLITNMPKKCPVPKETEYSIINFYLNEDILPFYVPIVNFEANFHMTTKSDYIFKVDAAAVIKSTKS